MGFLGKYLGRFLYAAFWVITGWWILNQAETYSKDLSGRYSAFHTFIQTTYNTTLPDFLNPSHLVANQVFVTQMLAYFQIAYEIFYKYSKDSEVFQQSESTDVH